MAASVAAASPPPAQAWADENSMKTGTGTTTNSGFDRATVQAVVEPVPVFISTESDTECLTYGLPRSYFRLLDIQSAGFP